MEKNCGNCNDIMNCESGHRCGNPMVYLDHGENVHRVTPETEACGFYSQAKNNEETKEEVMTESTEVRKTRFTVGEVLLGICFTIEGEENMGYVLPYLYNVNKVAKVNIVSLTVTEHHRVLNEWAPEGSDPDCDGFNLKDEAGKVWHNQYPRASYGQLSDEGNRRFTMHVTETGQVKKMMDNGEIFEVHLLTDVADKIHRGIKHFRENVESDHGGRLELLTELMEEIEEQLLEKYQKVLKEVPIWKEHPDITHFVLEDAPPPSPVDIGIKEQGFYMCGIPGTAFYSVGFYKHDKPELLLSIGDEDLVHLFNKICKDHLAGRLPIDKVFNCKWAKVGGVPARCIVRTVDHDDAAWLHKNLTTEVSVRSPTFAQYAILELPDSENNLPGEEGYEMGDQSVEMIKRNFKGLTLNTDEEG